MARLWLMRMAKVGGALIALFFILGQTMGPPGGGQQGHGDRVVEQREGALPGFELISEPDERQGILRVVSRIRAGGPYDYPENDNRVFGNYEGRLPKQDRGYYREFTVRTPKLKHRGARRLVTGKEGEIYYTRDHYESFIPLHEVP